MTKKKSTETDELTTVEAVATSEDTATLETVTAQKSDTSKVVVTASTANKIVNTSKIVSIPVTYEVGGVQESLMLPPRGSYTLPARAKVITNNKFIKVV